MYNIADLLRESGRPVDDNTLRAQISEWEDRVRKALKASNVDKHPKARFSGTVPLHLLPIRQQVELMGEYRQIIGVDSVINRLSETGSSPYSDFLESEIGIKGTKNPQVMNVWNSLAGDHDLKRKNPYGRFQSTRDDSLISRIYSSINLQLYGRSRPTKTGSFDKIPFVSGHFGLGSIPWLDQMDKPSNVNGLSGNALVFDLETAGFRPGSIRELSYSYVNLDSGEIGPISSTYMNPAQGTRGSMVSGGRVIPLNEFMDEKLGIKPQNLSTGDNFLDNVLPFLDKANRADYLIGHNIESFDMGQIFQGVAGTSRYQNDSQFKKYIDDLFDDLSTKTVDTLRLARQAPNLSNLTVSSALREGTPYAIDNLLLQTDLIKHIGIDRLAGAMGYDRESGVFTRGLHFGDVDSLVTTSLAQHVNELRQVSLLDSGFTGDELDLAKRIQQVISSSAAITPFTKIRDPANIHSKIKDMIGSGAAINPIEQEILLQRDLTMGVTDDALRATNRGVSSRGLLSVLGQYDRLVGAVDQNYPGVYNSQVGPTLSDFNKFRKVLRDKHFGFAGLSHEERLFGTAMSHLTSGVADKGFSRLSRDSLVSRFSTFNLNDIEYVTSSGKITLPPQVLNHLGLLDRTDNLAMFDLSVVQSTRAKAGQSINLAYRFQDVSDLDNVKTLLESMNSDEIDKFAEVMGMDRNSPTTITAFKRFRDAMKRDNLIDKFNSVDTAKFGVSVAQINDEESVKGIIELLRSSSNADDISDLSDQRLRFSLPFMNFEADETGKGVVRTAGAVLDLGLDDDARRMIGRNVQLASALYSPPAQVVEDGTTVIGRSGTGFRGLGDNIGISTAARMVGDMKNGDAAARHIQNFQLLDQKIIPNLPKIGLGLAAIGLASYMYAKKREMDQYDVAFEYGGNAPGPGRYAVADVLQARVESGYNGYARQIDPLATASLVDNMYYGSIGHTNTSFDRSNNIYGGLL